MSFLDLFSATDTAGTSAAKYRLHFLGSTLSDQSSWIFGMVTELVFTVYQLIVVPACALLGLVFSSGSWLQPLSDQYERFLGPLYAVFAPWKIACVGLAIVVASMLNSRVSTSKGKGFIFTSEALDRLGVALAMMALVAVLASNPAAVMIRVLEWDNALASDFASKVTHAGTGGAIEAGQALVDQAIRTPAIALNYSREFSDSCKQAWSESMSAGQELSVDSGCFVKGQNKAGPDTVVTAIAMWILPALPMLVFSIIAAWKFVVHITMSVLSAASLTWVAALKVHHRRGFDHVAENVAHMCAHTLMFVIIAAVTVALPSTCSGIAMQVIKPATNPDAQAALIMVTLGIGFAASTWVLLKVTSNRSALVRVLKADAYLTLESTLGVKPKRLGWNDFKFWKFNPFGTDSDGAAVSPSGGNASPSGGAAAVQGVVEANVSGPETVDGEDAVKALSAPPAPVAGAADTGGVPDPAAASTAVSAEYLSEVLAGPGASIHVEPPANRLWQLEHNSLYAQFTRMGDVYGYYTDNFTDNSTVSSPTRELVREVIEGEVIGTVYDDEAKSTAVALRPDSAPAGSAPNPGEPQHEHAALPPVPLADDPARNPSVPSPPLRPVPGNVYADSALNDLASAVGASFHIGPAELAQTISEMVTPGGFDGQPLAVSSGPFAVAAGPPPVVVDLADAEVAAGMPTSASGASHSDPVNDQQRWNRRAWRDSSAGEDVPIKHEGAADEAAPGDGELPLSGIHRGVNMHPAGFMAPMRDLLSADDLEAQMAEQRLVHAAAGESVAVLPPLGDHRLSVRLSSDPDERVVRTRDSDFADPL